MLMIYGRLILEVWLSILRQLSERRLLWHVMSSRGKSLTGLQFYRIKKWISLSKSTFCHPDEGMIYSMVSVIPGLSRNPIPAASVTVSVCFPVFFLMQIFRICQSRFPLKIATCLTSSEVKRNEKEFCNLGNQSGNRYKNEAWKILRLFGTFQPMKSTEQQRKRFWEEDWELVQGILDPSRCSEWWEQRKHWIPVFLLRSSTATENGSQEWQVQWSKMSRFLLLR